MNALVQVRDLRKTYGNGETAVEAVRGVSLDIARGEVILVMGPSGSGKTTFIQMLGGLLRPTSGSIRINGTDIAALRERELPPFRAKTFGFVFQDFNLVASLSVRENVEVALNIGGT
ncbi:ATP-binding cassette domain-containing protein, partial [Actinomadura sp. DSM 109109]|nr:ATP-binding cassette domain-containing protein [Actinomadura lepetitiana]